MENILDFIKVYPGAVSKELCDEIVNKYKDSDKFELALIESGSGKNVRNCYRYDMTEDKDIDAKIFDEQRADFLAALFPLTVGFNFATIEKLKQRRQLSA